MSLIIKAPKEIDSHRVSIWLISMGILWGQRPTVNFLNPIEFPYDALIENCETKAKLLWRYELTGHWLGWRGLHQISKNQACKTSVLNCLKRIFFIGEQSMSHIYKRCKRWFEILWSTITMRITFFVNHSCSNFSWKTLFTCVQYIIMEK